MTNYPIDSALAAAEGIFEIDLLNKVTGTSYPKAAVCGANTLGQVSQEYGADLGINPKDSKILFENKRTGASTSDTGETVESLGLQEGDVLAISDNAGVAADEEAFAIDLLNMCTGTTYPNVKVYLANTLLQIVDEYHTDIGINAKAKIHFHNKRTGYATSDSTLTVGELDLQEGDVLAISDDSDVAADESLDLQEGDVLAISDNAGVA